MPKPDFFIVGAPKCGTTSLARYLSQHPDVFIPSGPPREPHYFLPAAKRDPLDRDEYLQLFEPGAGCRRVGEKSVWYLYAPEVPRRIAEFEPDARIIVMLRNPADMLHSLHSELLTTRTENIEDFGEALRAEEDRKEGRRIPPGCDWPPMLFYSDVGRYSVQLGRYVETFGRDRVHVILFDDFVSDTPAAYRDVLRFLDVDSAFRPDFRVHNPNTKPRSPWLSYLRHNYPRWLRTLGQLLLPSEQLRRAIMDAIDSVNTKRQDREPMSPRLRQRLAREFRPEVQKLEDMLDRDLGEWYRPAADG